MVLCAPVAKWPLPHRLIAARVHAVLVGSMKFVRSILVVSCLLVAMPGRGQTDQPIYGDSLQNSWQDWSWSCTNNFNNTSVVHSGAKAISVTLTAGYAAFSLHHADMDSSPYASLSFWINGGATGGQRVQLAGLLGDANGGTVAGTTNLAPLAANTWRQVTVSLSALGVANQPTFTRFWLQDQTGSAQPVFYLDDIILIASTNAPVTNTTVAITVDAQLNRHAISPLIYGVAFASSNQLADGNFVLNRSGGNSETRYNWQLNAHNRGADWYFESLADSPSTPAAAADDFVANSKSGHADAMITISMIGWMPKLGAGRARLCSYATTNYGPQTDTDWQWFPVAGNGVGTNATAHTSWVITTNNPNDASFLTNSTFQQGFVQHLTNRWGLSTNGGVRYYLMDNEETIWHATHRDVHPVGTTMREIRDKFFDYAGMVKALDPNALVAAPEEWGWSGYFFSGYDQQNSGKLDRGTNGGWDYCPWLLTQFYQRATNTNQRLLDCFTLHCYPQGGEFGSDTSVSLQMLRNRSTRQLWDTNYVDASWIGSQPTNNILMLLPRMRSWVAQYYPGTKTGITEYNWGAEGHINGATAQADLLGIFGREGLDLATRWTAVATTNIVHKAMKMYRNYDGNKSTFGDTSVAAAVPNPDNVSTFAAVRSLDGALTVMVINKQITVSAAVSFTLRNISLSGTAQVWQLASANAITRLPDLNLVGNVLTNTVPAQSITLYVLPAATLVGPASNPNPGNGATGVATNTSLSWTAGTNASVHRVYFGANSNAVASASTNAPEYKGTLATTNYGPGVLASSGRFYWRVDEPAGTNLTTGAIWTFATAVSSAGAFPLGGTLGSGDAFSISFPSQIGQIYRVERSPSLNPASWSPAADNVPGTGAAIMIPDAGASSQRQRFYRVVILPP
jgi:hypothetical protein